MKGHFPFTYIWVWGTPQNHVGTLYTHNSLLSQVWTTPSVSRQMIIPALVLLEKWGLPTAHIICGHASTNLSYWKPKISSSDNDPGSHPLEVIEGRKRVPPWLLHPTHPFDDFKPLATFNNWGHITLNIFLRLYKNKQMHTCAHTQTLKELSHYTLFHSITQIFFSR